MAFCFGKGRGFGPRVVFAIGHLQEKGITPAPSRRRGSPQHRQEKGITPAPPGEGDHPSPKPAAGSASPQTSGTAFPSAPKAGGRAPLSVPAPGYNVRCWGWPASPLGTPPWCIMKPPRDHLPHGAGREQAGYQPLTHRAPVLPTAATIQKQSGLHPCWDKVANILP